MLYTFFPGSLHALGYCASAHLSGYLPKAWKKSLENHIYLSKYPYVRCYIQSAIKYHFWRPFFYDLILIISIAFCKRGLRSVEFLVQVNEVHAR